MQPTAALFAAFALITPLLAQDPAPAPAKKADLWLQDFAAAKAKAKAENKHLLLDFTGSDWCSWCIKLDEEVFAKAAFQGEAPKHFVLVKLDYPNDKSLVTEAVRAQNEELQGRYQIEGYPTILLTDCDGVVYAQTGYREGGADDYNTHLAELKAVGAAFGKAMGKAKDQQGAERAKSLAEALDALEEAVVSQHHIALLEEISTLDADGKAGLKAKYADQLKAAKEAAAERAAMAAVAKEARVVQEAIDSLMEAKKHDEALAKLDTFIQKPANPTQHQIALFFKGMVTMEARNDPAAAVELLKSALALNAESPIGKQVEMILPQLEKMAKAKAADGGNDQKKGDQKKGDEKQGK